MNAKIAPELAPLAVPLADLRPDPRNARSHNERNITEVMASYDAHGQRKPIVVQLKADDGTPMVVRAGNGQCEAARRLGWTHIAAITVDERDKDAIAFALRDNRTAELAEWNLEALGENLRYLQEQTYDLTTLGWDGAEALAIMNPEPEVEVDEHTRKPPTHKVRPPAVMTNADWELHLGDCLEGLKQLPDNSIDSIVTDPPAGIGFMGKGWDSDKGGRDKWVAWLQAIMTECLRVLKPGGHLLAWALPRTSHWTMLAIENAGFELRDVVYHAFGTGFPKSTDVSKQIDQKLGAKRGIIGKQNAPGQQLIEMARGGKHNDGANAWTGNVLGGPITEQAQQWDGWGTALKPAVEPWIMARKPLAGTIAENVLAHGVGGINIAGARIGDDVRTNTPTGDHSDSSTPIISGEGASSEVVGRWPAHLVLSHGAGCVPIGTFTDTHAIGVGPKLGEASRSLEFGMGTRQTEHVQTEHVRYRCVLDCPVRLLNVQSNVGDEQQDDSTGAGSRIYYIAKPARAEAEAGLDDFEAHTGGEATDRKDGTDGLNSPRAGAGRIGGRKNIHPTKKSIALMRWLVRLVTPPGGRVLDAFAGSGTTGLAALVEGCRFIGFELSPEYHAIAHARLTSIIEDPSAADDADKETQLAKATASSIATGLAESNHCLFPACPHPGRCEDRCVARTSAKKDSK